MLCRRKLVCLCVVCFLFSYPSPASGTVSPVPAVQPAAVCRLGCVCRRIRPWRWSEPAVPARSTAWAGPLWKPSSSGSHRMFHPVYRAPGRETQHVMYVRSKLSKCKKMFTVLCPWLKKKNRQMTSIIPWVNHSIYKTWMYPKAAILLMARAHFSSSSIKIV